MEEKVEFELIQDSFIDGYRPRINRRPNQNVWYSSVLAPTSIQCKWFLRRKRLILANFKQITQI